MRNDLTAVSPRYRGALTGNRLTPLFGRIIREDVFSCSDELVRKDIFSLCDVTLWPMAWSDNLVVIANDMRKAGLIMSVIARQLHDIQGLAIEPGTPEIIPACSRHLNWPSLHIGGLDISVKDSFKCLGFTITCNGDTTVQKHGMLGALRGLLSSATKTVAQVGVSQYCKAKWWKAQLNGIVGYSAAFIGLGRALYQELHVISNNAARLVAKLPPRYNVGPVFDLIKSEHKIDVPDIFSLSVVCRMAHCFRHPNTPVFQFLSRPIQKRLTSLRSVGMRSEVLDFSLRYHAFLQV